MGRGRTDEMNSPKFDGDGNLMEFSVADNLTMKHGLQSSSDEHFQDGFKFSSATYQRNTSNR